MAQQLLLMGTTTPLPSTGRGGPTQRRFLVLSYQMTAMTAEDTGFRATACIYLHNSALILTRLNVDKSFEVTLMTSSKQATLVWIIMNIGANTHTHGKNKMSQCFVEYLNFIII